MISYGPRFHTSFFSSPSLCWIVLQIQWDLNDFDVYLNDVYWFLICIFWKFVLRGVWCRTSLLVPLSELSLALWLELVVVQLWVVQGLLAWFCPQRSHENQWSSNEVQMKFSKCLYRLRHVRYVLKCFEYIWIACSILLAFLNMF